MNEKQGNDEVEKEIDEAIKKLDEAVEISEAARLHKEQRKQRMLDSKIATTMAFYPYGHKEPLLTTKQRQCSIKENWRKVPYFEAAREYETDMQLFTQLDRLLKARKQYALTENREAGYAMVDDINKEIKKLLSII